MKRILYIIAFLFVFTGCKHEEYNEPVDSRSGIRLSISIDVSMSNTTKAFVSDDFDLKMSHLKGLIKRGDKIIGQWGDMSKAPEVIFLDPGIYTISLQTNGIRKEMNNVPMYVGETSFTVESGKLSAIKAGVAIESSAVKVELTGGLTSLTDYKLSFYHLSDPLNDLFVVTQAQNNPQPKKLYMDKTFPFGVRIEGKMNGRSWKKNVIVYEVAHKSYYNLTVN